MPLRVIKYDRVQNLAKLKVSELKALPVPMAIKDMAATVIHNRYVLLTGGWTRWYEVTNTTYLLDVDANDWIDSPEQPRLVEARSHHASCTVGAIAFVFAGYNDGSMLDTIERKHFEMDQDG